MSVASRGRAMTSEPRMLHIAAVFAGALEQLRGLVVPIVIAAFIGGHGGGQSISRAVIYTGVTTAATTIYAAIRWSRTRWFLDDESIRLRQGVLSESITTVPLDRVQSVDTARGPIQRLFGVVEVQVQTAGGGRAAELVLKAVAEADADEIRESVRHAGGEVVDEKGDGAEAEQDRPEWRLSPRGLLAAAATSGSLAVLVPAAAAAFQLGQDVLSEKAVQRLVPDTPLTIARDVVAVLVVAWLLSAAGTVAAFAGFRATRDGNRLVIERGALQRRHSSIPVARVQAVRVIEGLLRQPFGLAQIRIDTAGYAHEAASAQTLIPIMRHRDAAEVIARLLPELAGGLGDLAPVPARAARRYVLPLTLPAVLAAIVLAIVVGLPGLLVAVLALPGALLGISRYRASGYRLAGR